MVLHENFCIKKLIKHLNLFYNRLKKFPSILYISFLKTAHFYSKGV